MITVSTSPPPGWAEDCAAHGRLFHSPTWQALLEQCFSCRTLYVADDDSGDRGAVTEFRAGPFRIGYLGFPYGGLVNPTSSVADLVRGLRDATNKPVALRVPVSAFESPVSLDLRFDATRETAIADLGSWSLDALSTNMQRDVKQSLRSELTIEDAETADDGSRLFDLYRQTVQRNKGSIRYNDSYFRGLVEQSRNHPNLRVLVSRSGADIAAFTAVARHGTTACYLHGATDWNLRKHQPSAGLLHDCITWARDSGCTTFNLMSSPAGQDSLVRYKERWGAETREHRTYEMPLGATYPLFRLAAAVYGRVG